MASAVKWDYLRRRLIWAGMKRAPILRFCIQHPDRHQADSQRSGFSGYLTRPRRVLSGARTQREITSAIR